MLQVRAAGEGGLGEFPRRPAPPTAGQPRVGRGKRSEPRPTPHGARVAANPNECWGSSGRNALAPMTIGVATRRPSSDARRSAGLPYGVILPWRAPIRQRRGESGWQTTCRMRGVQPSPTREAPPAILPPKQRPLGSSPQVLRSTEAIRLKTRVFSQKGDAASGVDELALSSPRCLRGAQCPLQAFSPCSTQAKGVVFRNKE
jgi:hypothetical protein